VARVAACTDTGQGWWCSATPPDRGRSASWPPAASRRPRRSSSRCSVTGGLISTGGYYQARDCDNLPRGPRPDGPALSDVLADPASRAGCASVRRAAAAPPVLASIQLKNTKKSRGPCRGGYARAPVRLVRVHGVRPPPDRSRPAGAGGHAQGRRGTCAAVAHGCSRARDQRVRTRPRQDRADRVGSADSAGPAIRGSRESVRDHARQPFPHAYEQSQRAVKHT
jgi:hypothetical protein